jgi:hypothetical protein
MQRLHRLFGMLLLASAFLAPTLTAQEKKTDDPKTETKKTKPKVDWGPEIVAKLTVVDTKDEKEFTVQIQVKVQEPNPSGQQAVLQAQQQVVQAKVNLAKAKNPNEYNNALKSLNDAQIAYQKAVAGLVKLKDVTIDFKCKTPEGGMRVRSYTPIPEVDENTGEFKKLTKKEMEELRADGYPGYPAEFKNLAVGQIVHVYFTKDTKSSSLYGADKKGPPKKLGVDDIQDDANQPRLDVVQILILQEPQDKKK